MAYSQSLMQILSITWLKKILSTTNFYIFKNLTSYFITPKFNILITNYIYAQYLNFLNFLNEMNCRF
jgi:hypothetical protein